MNKSDFSRIRQEIYGSLGMLSNTKGNEYTGDDNAFSNFERLAKELGLPRQSVLWVYFRKHVDSISTFIKTGKEGSEPIEGRILDAILYLELLFAMVKETKESVKCGHIKTDKVDQ